MHSEVRAELTSDTSWQLRTTGGQKEYAAGRVCAVLPVLPASWLGCACISVLRERGARMQASGHCSAQALITMARTSQSNHRS